MENLVRKYAHKWMDWYLKGEGKYDGHNWNSHRTLEEKNSAPQIVWDIVADAVHLFQIQLDKKKRYYDQGDLEFILTGEPPRSFERDVKYHFWNLHTVLKLTDQYTVKTKEEQNYNLALQQFTGFRHRAEGYNLESLVDSMGLTEEEWKKMKRTGDVEVLPKESRKAIDEHFQDLEEA